MLGFFDLTRNIAPKLANSLLSSCCSDGAKLISADGHNIPELLAAILKLFPLDTYVFNAVIVMDLVNADKQKNLEVIDVLCRKALAPSKGVLVKFQTRHKKSAISPYNFRPNLT